MALFQDNEEKLQAEIRELKRENLRLNESLRGFQDDAQRKTEQFADRVDRLQSTFIRIRELAGCLDVKTALEFAWQILTNSFQIERGGIFKIESGRLVPVIGTKLPAEHPEVPLEEESMITYALRRNLTLTLRNLRENQELSGLERRGAYPDARIVSPFQVSGILGGAIVICKYGNRLFSESGETDLIRLVASILGLSLTNARIIEEQRKTLDNRTRELEKVRGIFSRMVAPEVIKSIEANPAGISLGGSRHAVVTMFVDIRGFTALSETLSPEKLVEMLNQYFGCITEIIIRHRGTLDKFIGDAVMALFGTPLPLKDSVTWAFAAAVEIQREVQKLVDKLETEGFPRFGIGIGLNYQEVVAGMIGSERMSSFTAIGDGVNTASRFCSTALAGEIAVGESVYEQMKEWPGTFEAREGIVLKGKSKPVSIYVHIPGPQTPSIPLPHEDPATAISPGETTAGEGAAPADAGPDVNRTGEVSWTGNPEDLASFLGTDLTEESEIVFRGDRPISITEERRRRELAVPYLDGWGNLRELSALLPIAGVPPTSQNPPDVPEAQEPRAAETDAGAPLEGESDGPVEMERGAAAEDEGGMTAGADLGMAAEIEPGATVETEWRVSVDLEPVVAAAAEPGAAIGPEPGVAAGEEPAVTAGAERGVEGEVVAVMDDGPNAPALDFAPGFETDVAPEEALDEELDEELDEALDEALDEKLDEELEEAPEKDLEEESEEDDLWDLDEIPDDPKPIVILPEIPPKSPPGAAVKTCSRCGAVLKINVRFCGSCGHAN